MERCEVDVSEHQILNKVWQIEQYEPFNPVHRINFTACLSMLAHVSPRQMGDALGQVLLNPLPSERKV